MRTLEKQARGPDAVKDVRLRVGLDARSPRAWAAATGGEDVQDPLGARVGAAGVPCMPCGGSPGVRRTAQRETRHERRGDVRVGRGEGAWVGDMT